MEKQMPEAHHIVMAMPPQPDCRLVGSWLLKVAEAGDLLEAKWADDPAYIQSLCHFSIVLEAAALEIVSALRFDNDDRPFHGYEKNHVMAVELGFDDTGDFDVEFAILVELGFFVLVDDHYQMAIPGLLTLEHMTMVLSKVRSSQDDVGD